MVRECKPHELDHPGLKLRARERYTLLPQKSYSAVVCIPAVRPVINNLLFPQNFHKPEHSLLFSRMLLLLYRTAFAKKALQTYIPKSV